MNKKLTVTKYDGTRQPYDQAKVVNSLMRAGLPKKEVLSVLALIESQLDDGISTQKLYQIVNQQLSKEPLLNKPHFYRLREELSQTDPTVFEKFVQKILEDEGYRCRWNVLVKGECIDHQIDIIAEKGKDLFFVEVKHHQNPHRDCGLGTVIELWGRLDDLQKGFALGKNRYRFTQAWLFCNTKFSEHAITYARAKGLKLTGWRYGSDGTGLEQMIEKIEPEAVRATLRQLSQLPKDHLETSNETL